MIIPEYFFNEHSICIFTDASYRRNRDYKHGDTSRGTTAPAAMVYHRYDLIDQDFNILHNTTSQVGELHAVLLGVMLAYKYRNYRVRLFSDSQNSIFAIRDRIFKWVRSQEAGNNVLGDDGSLKNQEDIMQIVYYIISNNFPMEFYHVKGHVYDYYDYDHAQEVFKYSNGYDIDLKTTQLLGIYNNRVDEFSTAMLRRYENSKKYNTKGFKVPITIGYAPFDMGNYFNLVNCKDRN